MSATALPLPLDDDSKRYQSVRGSTGGSGRDKVRHVGRLYVEAAGETYHSSGIFQGELLVTFWLCRQLALSLLINPLDDWLALLSQKEYVATGSHHGIPASARPAASQSVNPA